MGCGTTHPGADESRRERGATRDAREADLALRDHEVVARRALVVSLGLLGTRVDYALACPSRDDSEDASAWVFSTVLADISNAAAVIGTSGQGARGAAGDVLDTARSRIAMGFALAASG